MAVKMPSGTGALAAVVLMFWCQRKLRAPFGMGSASLKSPDWMSPEYCE